MIDKTEKMFELLYYLGKDISDKIESNMGNLIKELALSGTKIVDTIPGFVVEDKFNKYISDTCTTDPSKSGLIFKLLVPKSGLINGEILDAKDIALYIKQLLIDYTKIFEVNIEINVMYAVNDIVWDQECINAVIPLIDDEVNKLMEARRKS